MSLTRNSHENSGFTRISPDLDATSADPRAPRLRAPKGKLTQVAFLIAILHAGLPEPAASAEEFFRPFVGIGWGLPWAGVSVADNVVTYDFTNRFVWRLPVVIGAELDPHMSVFVRVFVEVVPGAPGDNISSLSWETGIRWQPWKHGLFLGASVVPQRFALGMGGSIGYNVALGPVRVVPEIQLVSSASFVPAWTTVLSAAIVVEIPFLVGTSAIPNEFD